MRIETRRLLLRPMEPDDLNEFAALHADPEVTRFVRPLDDDEAKARLERDAQEWHERGHGLLAILERKGGAFLGRCGLKHWPQFDETELGWLRGRGARRVAALVAFEDEGASGFWEAAGYPHDEETDRRVRNL